MYFILSSWTLPTLSLHFLTFITSFNTGHHVIEFVNFYIMYHVIQFLSSLCCGWYVCFHCHACYLDILLYRCICYKWFHNRLRSFASGHTGNMAASYSGHLYTDRLVTTDSHVGNKGSWTFTVNGIKVNNSGINFVILLYLLWVEAISPNWYEKLAISVGVSFINYCAL